MDCIHQPLFVHWGLHHQCSLNPVTDITKYQFHNRKTEPSSNIL